MPELVIADASCLIALSNIGEVGLMREIFGRVVLTPTVADEFGLELSDWMDIRSPEDQVKFNNLLQLLDRGEASAIALAIELPGSLLILDDAKARKCAEAEGLRITGTIGILLGAYKRGLISAIEPAIVQLRAKGFRISNALYDTAIQLARGR